MSTIVVDCAAVHSEGDLWAAYLDAAKPEGAELFGRNLDAFWDAVSAGGPGWPGECELRFVNTHTLAPLRGGGFLAARKQIAADSTFVPMVFE
jgi:RNAse (barnase) inhibitor barstar